ncbi:methyltransferase-like protein 17, mitochondrial [Chenopodium quinoa]|uniref:methyltransferase-like protein 17, mitochondrial n=1 Tax=Chenopodium quinoa TaxID=63459 RepID=UPI000B78646E|nr:methyltransferase-like protein 17, mitochondrial [Chenopodium quinoa]
MSALIPETSRRIITPESIRSAAKQSSKCLVIPVRLRRAIEKYLQEQEMGHMKKKVLRLSASFAEIKDVNRLLPMSISKELVEDPLKSMEQSKRWKIKSEYGDIGLTYTDDETVAYVATRMPAVYSACYRILREIKRRVPEFSPVNVLDFGSGTGSAFWALREVWPKSLERINLIEPSQSMQRAGVSLVRDIKDLPLVHSYNKIQSLTQDIKKAERAHDLVIASYVLGEIPSLKDRIAIARQLWGLTRDILVLVEPGTPEGFNIISQMRSHILWMEKRKRRKLEAKMRKTDGAAENLEASNVGAFVIAPCPHDGPCPLAKSGKYCHFVQRLERTESQRAFKRSNGSPLRGFEDEKFSYVVLRRGKRPQDPWPLDGIKFDTLKELRAKRNPEELEIDYEDQSELEPDEIVLSEAPPSYDSDATESGTDIDHEDEEEGEQLSRADLGSGWGRIIFMPQKRGRRVEMDVCRATKHDGSEGSFDHLVVTRAKNPTLHHQARKSLWGDLWPL